MVRTVIIVQARMTSSRLPGKVMMPLLGKPMICRLIERLQRVELADDIVVATTTNAQDDVLEAVTGDLAVSLYRGSENDVLLRYVEAARLHKADAVVRITADCPLIDPELINAIVRRFESDQADYISNLHPPTWPYGMAVEVFSRSALEEAGELATESAEREHVTPYIYRHPERFTICNVENDKDWSDLRWTVDTNEDYELVSLLFDAAYRVRKEFTFDDVLSVSQAHPDWMRINQHINQVKV